MREYKSKGGSVIETGHLTDKYNIYIGDKSDIAHTVIFKNPTFFVTTKRKTTSDIKTTYIPKVLYFEGVKDTESKTPIVVKALLDQLARKHYKPSKKTKNKKEISATEIEQIGQFFVEEGTDKKERLLKSEEDTHLIVYNKKFQRKYKKVAPSLYVVEVLRDNMSSLTTIADETNIYKTQVKMACSLLHEKDLS